MKIPTIGLGEVRQDVVSQPTATAEQFGAGKYRLVGQLAETASKIGLAYEKSKVDIEVAGLESSIADATLKYNQAKQAVLKDYQGVNMAKREEEFIKLADQIDSEVLKDRPEWLRRKGSDGLLRLRTSSTLSLRDNTARDAEQFQIKSYEAAADSHISAAASADSDVLANESIAQGLASVEEMALLRGYTDEMRVNALADYKTKAYISRANSLLNNGSGAGAIEAKQYLEANKDNISSEEYGRAIAAVDKLYAEEVKKKTVADFFDANKGRTIEDMRATASSLPEETSVLLLPEITKLEERMNKLNSAQVAKMVSNVINGSAIGIDLGNNLTDSIPGIYDTITYISNAPDSVVDGDRFDEIALAGTSADGWRAIPQMISDSEQGAISKNQAVQLMNFYTKNLAGEDARNDALAMTKPNEQKQLFQKIVGGKADSKNEKWLRFNAKLGDAITNEISKRNGKALSRDEEMKVAMGVMLTMGGERETWLWGNKKASVSDIKVVANKLGYTSNDRKYGKEVLAEMIVDLGVDLPDDEYGATRSEKINALISRGKSEMEIILGTGLEDLY